MSIILVQPNNAAATKSVDPRMVLASSDVSPVLKVSAVTMVCVKVILAMVFNARVTNAVKKASV